MHCEVHESPNNAIICPSQDPSQSMVSFAPFTRSTSDYPGRRFFFFAGKVTKVPKTGNIGENCCSFKFKSSEVFFVLENPIKLFLFKVQGV